MPEQISYFIETFETTFTAITHTVKHGFVSSIFMLGEKTQFISDKVGLSIIMFTYNFVSEPTQISEVKTEIIDSATVKISWNTNHPATGKVNFGFQEGEYEFEQQTEKRTTYHEFILTDLKPGTEYHYEVMSQNKNYVYDANRQFRTPLETELQ